MQRTIPELFQILRNCFVEQDSSFVIQSSLLFELGNSYRVLFIMTHLLVYSCLTTCITNRYRNSCVGLSCNLTYNRRSYLGPKPSLNTSYLLFVPYSPYSPCSPCFH